MAEQCEALEQGLLELAQGLLAQVRRTPFTLLPARLIEQRTSARTTFLRWQHIATRRMGVGVWAEMLRQDKTPEYLLQDLYEMELQRITLNMQISLIHSIGKQAAECAERWARPRPSSWADCSRAPTTTDWRFIMATPSSEGNIGSAPEHRSFPNGNNPRGSCCVST